MIKMKSILTSTFQQLSGGTEPLLSELDSFLLRFIKIVISQ